MVHSLSHQSSNESLNRSVVPAVVSEYLYAREFEDLCAHTVQEFRVVLTPPVSCHYTILLFRDMSEVQLEPNPSDDP